MQIKTVIKLIEPKTFGASVIPVVYGSVFSWYSYGKMNLLNLVILMLGMMLVQGATNMINDYFDHQRERGATDKADEKALSSGDISLKELAKLIKIFVGAALIIGILYSMQYSWWILLVIVLASAVLVGYSAGPLPLCYTPFGELAAGLTMGFGITATVIFIQSGEFSTGTLLACLPTVLFISALLLANNLSDWREDVKEGRKTTVILMGERNASVLWLSLLMGMSVVSGALSYMGIWPISAAVLSVLSLPVSGIFKAVRVEKIRKNKGMLMGSTSKQGMMFHFIVILTLATVSAIK